MLSLELIRLLPTLSSVDEEILCGYISEGEVQAFSESLGLDFRDTMLAKAADFSTAVQFEESKTYASDQLVYHRFEIYKSLIANNTDLISNVASWEKQVYFTDLNMNKLWYSGLGKYVAMAIYKIAAPFLVYRAGGKGITTIFEDSGDRTITPKELYTYMRSIDNAMNASKRGFTYYYNKLFKSQEADSCSDNTNNLGEYEQDRIAWD